MYGTVRAYGVLGTIIAFNTKKAVNTIYSCLQRRKMPQNIVKYMVSAARIAKVFKHTSQIY